MASNSLHSQGSKDTATLLTRHPSNPRPQYQVSQDAPGCCHGSVAISAPGGSSPLSEAAEDMKRGSCVQDLTAESLVVFWHLISVFSKHERKDALSGVLSEQLRDPQIRGWT